MQTGERLSGSRGWCRAERPGGVDGPQPWLSLPGIPLWAEGQEPAQACPPHPAPVVRIQAESLDGSRPAWPTTQSLSPQALFSDLSHLCWELEGSGPGLRTWKELTKRTEEFGKSASQPLHTLSCQPHGQGTSDARITLLSHTSACYIYG